MPKIPVPDINDMPTEIEDLPEDVSYKTIIRKFALSPTQDKRGYNFLTGGELEVVEPEEWQGRRIFVNYLPVPQVLPPGASKAEKKANDDIGIEFVRMCKCTKVKFVNGELDPDDLIGLEPEVMVKNEEYNNRNSAKVALWLM